MKHLEGLKYQHIASHALNRPLFLEPVYAATLFGFLGDRMGFRLDAGDIEDLPEGEDIDFASLRQPREQLSWYRHPSYSHLGVLPVDGTISSSKGFGGIGSLSGLTYSSIQNDFQDANNDDSISAIAVPMNCNGGGADFCPETALMIRDTKRKPVIAYATRMYSAAMYLGAAADSIYLNQHSGIGSIGAVMTHAEQSQQLENRGVKVRIFRSGNQKFRGNSLEGLDEETANKLQQDVERDGRLFAEFVGESRNVSVDRIINQQAGTFRGRDGIAEGLADHEVSGEAEFFSVVAAQHAPPKSKTISIAAPSATTDAQLGERTRMSGENDGAITLSAAELKERDDKLTTSAAEKAIADYVAAEAEKKRLAEERASAILQSDEGKARPKMAEKLVKSAMSADDAISAMAFAPEEKEERPRSESALADTDIDTDFGGAENSQDNNDKNQPVKEDEKLYALVTGFVEGQQGENSAQAAEMKEFAAVCLEQDRTKGRDITKKRNSGVAQ